MKIPSHIKEANLVSCIREIKGNVKHSSADYGARIAEILSENLEFRRFLGEGGESIVFEAINKEMARVVAVKVALNYINAKGKEVGYHYSGLKKQKETFINHYNEFRERFLRGLKLQRTLASYKNDYGKIPKIIEGPPDFPPYWVQMELIPGESVVAWSKGKSLHRKLDFFCKLLPLVNFIHSYRVIHRDLKSSNIMVLNDKDNYDVPVIIDFGIAKTIQGGKAKDVTCIEKLGLGDRHYSAPEQLADAGKVDYTADIFTLGQTLQDILTEKYPTEQQDLSIFPNSLQQIYHKATERRKSRRFYHASEFRDAIQAIMRTIKKDKTQLDMILDLPDGDLYLSVYNAIKGCIRS